MTVEHGEVPGTFKVYYNVDLRDYQNCDCDAGVRDIPCRHLKAAQQFAKGEPVTFWEPK